LEKKELAHHGREKEVKDSKGDRGPSGRGGGKKIGESIGEGEFKRRGFHRSITLAERRKGKTELKITGKRGKLIERRADQGARTNQRKKTA